MKSENRDGAVSIVDTSVGYFTSKEVDLIFELMDSYFG
jgi:hypothetical protein